ncbi:MAG: hypothetical protein JRI91_01090 [Deltaproteobacteria bacterium]|nr:hypothetical protein [Deltaproteobacteria bacterium]
MNHHHHDHEIKSELTFDEKLEKLLSHWIKHNEDHAETYREWMAKAEDNGLANIGKILLEAADLTLQINSKLKEALKQPIV